MTEAEKLRRAYLGDRIWNAAITTVMFGIGLTAQQMHYQSAIVNSNEWMGAQCKALGIDPPEGTNFEEAICSMYEEHGLAIIVQLAANLYRSNEKQIQQGAADGERKYHAATARKLAARFNNEVPASYDRNRIGHQATAKRFYYHG